MGSCTAGKVLSKSQICWCLFGPSLTLKRVLLDFLVWKVLLFWCFHNKVLWKRSFILCAFFTFAFFSNCSLHPSETISAILWNHLHISLITDSRFYCFSTKIVLCTLLFCHWCPFRNKAVTGKGMLCHSGYFPLHFH